ncbi:hypothetical protein N9933_01165 [bacterium]|nr:hypothetical protein [bacterium]
MEYTSINRILSGLERDLKGVEYNEMDVIEWTGEALGQMKVASIQESKVAFMNVVGHETSLPTGLHSILQISKDNTGCTSNSGCTGTLMKAFHSSEGACPKMTDCHGNQIVNVGPPYQKEYFDLHCAYDQWATSSYYRQRFSPVRLANHTLFNSLVCKETDQSPYTNVVDEYTVVGTQERKIRFSFPNGVVAVSYLANAIDSETGYPLIPDDISFTSAIMYYIKWKLAEWHSWMGVEGFSNLTMYSEERWLRYCKQAKNKAMMPHGIDDYQDLLEMSHQLIPRLDRYYGYFGNLGSHEYIGRNRREYNITGKDSFDYNSLSCKTDISCDPSPGCQIASCPTGTLEIQELTSYEISLLTPTELVIVYNTTTQQFQGWNGIMWVDLDTDGLSTVTNYISDIDGIYVYSGYELNGVPIITRCQTGGPEEFAQGVTSLSTDWPNRLILTYI